MSKFKDTTLNSKLIRRVHRRIVLAGLLKASTVALLGWNIRKLQIEDSEDYKLLADANRVSIGSSTGSAITSSVALAIVVSSTPSIT